MIALVGFYGAAQGGVASTILPLGIKISEVSTAAVDVTTDLAVSSGETIVVAIATRGGGTVSSVTDTASNTYAEALSQESSGARNVAIWHCLNPSALAQGSTITVSFSGGGSRRAIAASKLDGTAALSSIGSGTGNSTSPSATTAASVASGAFAFGAIMTEDALITQPGGIWASDYNGAVLDDAAALAHGETTSAGTVTYNPTLSKQENWTCGIAAYT